MYFCEKCGKVVYKKYGSGRFCSRECANSRIQTSEINDKRRNTFRSTKPVRQLQCVMCGCWFDAPRLKNGIRNIHVKTCSKKCLLALKSKNSLGNSGGGFRKGSAKNYKYGYFRGIECDSSWELAYLVFCLDHGIKIERNKNSFTYTYNSKAHRYYPDFVLEDGTYIEIKNYVSEQVLAKQEQFPKTLKYKILFKEDLKEVIKYCQIKYGKNFTEVLYDKDKESYLTRSK